MHELLDRRFTQVARLGARSERLGSTLRMSVIAQRPALIAWYRRRGFGPTGEHFPFPYGDARFGSPRRPDLYFVTLERRLG